MAEFGVLLLLKVLKIITNNVYSESTPTLANEHYLYETLNLRDEGLAFFIFDRLI